jgi:dihydrofolate reductase
MARPLGGTTAPLALIVAVARNGVIGAGNALPWRLPEDLRRFKALTLGHAIIMGRRTWDSLRGALPGRQNIVVTRQRSFEAPGADVAHSLADALAGVTLPPPAWCIGGAELFREALPLASRIELTAIDADVPGDTFLPPIDWAQWREVAREPHPAGASGLAYAFVTYVRAGDSTAPSPPPPLGASP